jgi:methyl-accepting chemotaxis protein
MSRILAIESTVALAGAAVTEVLGYLGFSHPSSPVNLSYYRTANIVVAVLCLVISACFLHRRLYPISRFLATEDESVLRAKDPAKLRGLVIGLPDVTVGLHAAAGILGGLIMGVAHGYSAGVPLISLRLGLCFAASWSLIALLDYHLLRVLLMPVAQDLATKSQAEGSESIDSPRVFRRFVIGGLIISAVSAILVAIVLHGSLEVQAGFDAGIGRVVAAFVLTQSVTALALYYIGISVARPLNHLIELTRQVGQGDLTARFASVTGDEIEAVGWTFNSMVDSLRKMTLELKNVMEEVSSVSASIMEIAEQQTHRGEERAVAVTQISASIEHVSKTAQQVAEHCESMVRSAERALEQAMEGQKLVGDTAEGMERIRDTVTAMSKHILALGEKSKQIGDIIETISGIADETHLLALNAAIESAGAGEHGRRFAVVASEVKRLAQRSVTQTSDIKKILTEIQMAANASVLATEQGIKEVEAGSSLARGARESIDRVIALVDDTAQRTRGISDATEQQKQANLQVVTSMREITAASREAAAANKQSRALARSLTDLAQKLSVIVRLFSVDGPVSALDKLINGTETQESDNVEIVVE